VSENAQTPTAAQPIGLWNLIDAERREQEGWATSIPSWHPTNEAVPGAPAGDGAAAPQEGGQGGLPWNLDAHPEELRPYLAEELRKVEGGITQRFQEAAEFRRQVEPLLPLLEVEGLDLSQISQEDLSGLLGLYPTFSDPEAFESWWESVGNEMGFFDGDGPDGAGDGPDGAGGEEPPAWAQSLVERLDALEGNVQERSQTDAERDALAEIDAEMAQIKSDNPDLKWDNEELAVEDRILQLAMSYGDDPEALSKGLADYRAITGAAQGTLLDAAETAPANALTGGNGDAAPEEIRGFDDAKAAAKKRFAGAR
jgi:hypothetical protein